MHEFIQNLITHQASIAVAYALYALIIFAETGLLLGAVIPLPGDSLLFTLGLLAAQGYFNIYALLLIGCVAAILGDSVGYLFGRKIGPALADKTIGRFELRPHVKKTEEFYAKYGKKTIIIARFVPFARALAPIMAGVGKMDYPTFISYNVIGGISWIVSVTLLGYFLGLLVPGIEKYLLPIVGAIIVASIIPPFLTYLKERKKVLADQAE